MANLGGSVERVHAILGIDAAWTVAASSGVALIVGEPGRWRCVRAAPSRRMFVAGGGLAPVDFAVASKDDDVAFADLVAVATALARVDALSVVAVDIPLARGPIVARRAADTAVSRAFGARGCAVHSPTPMRPGRLACRMRDDASACGFPLVTGGTAVVPALIEVYPHVTVLDLMGAAFRVPYKVARARKYWPKVARGVRIASLIEQWRGIESALVRRIGALPGDFVVGEQAPTRVLKGYEDALDGIVCAWTGALYLEGGVVPMGDESAAIWCPRS
jgi:predicted RNase H-like nuclease